PHPRQTLSTYKSPIIKPNTRSTSTQPLHCSNNTLILNIQIRQNTKNPRHTPLQTIPIHSQPTLVHVTKQILLFHLP
ncbi:MAG: hypothetical protein WDA42_08695, partial [Candidatus Bathyarchaeia archaeon]